MENFEVKNLTSTMLRRIGIEAADATVRMAAYAELERREEVNREQVKIYKVFTR